MSMSLDGAVTPCPGCKKEVSIKARKCPQCGAAADGDSPLISFRRPDGSGGLVDQKTLAFLRSEKPKASQRALDALFESATRIVYLEMTRETGARAFEPKLTMDESETLERLKRCLAVHPGGGAHLMSIATARLDFYRGQNVIAQIEVVRRMVLRCKAKWQDDAMLVDGRALAGFFRDRGCPGMWEEMEEEEALRRENEKKRLDWRVTWNAAIPRGTHAMVEALDQDMYGGAYQSLVELQEVLAREYPAEMERVLLLFAWYGHAGGAGLWSGYPPIEGVPERLLETFDPSTLVRALEDGALSEQHLAGAARLLGRWASKDQKMFQKAWIEAIKNSRVRGVLVEYLRQGGDTSKCRALEHAINRSGD
jgi:hypothetical protein